MATRTLVILATVLIALLTAGSPALAMQPHQPQDDTPSKSAEQPKTSNPEALRKRLLHTLKFAKRIVEKHEDALAQLDAGEDPRQVMKSLRTPEFRRIVRGTLRATSAPNTQASSQTRRNQSSKEASPQEIKAVRRFIKKHLGIMDMQLNNIEKTHPGSTELLVARLAPKILEIIRLNEQDPEFAALKLDDLKAGLKFLDVTRTFQAQLRPGVADESAIKQAELDVRNAATERFTIQVKIKQYEIDQLQARVEELRTALDDLDKQQEEQVNAQVLAARRVPGRRTPHQHIKQNKQGQAASPAQPANNAEDD